MAAAAPIGTVPTADDQDEVARRADPRLGRPGPVALTGGTPSADAPEAPGSGMSASGVAPLPGRYPDSPRAAGTRPSAAVDAADRDQSYAEVGRQWPISTGSEMAGPAAAAWAAERGMLTGPGPTAQVAAGPPSSATIRHLLGRATFGSRPADPVHLQKIGVDAWMEEQLSLKIIDNPDGGAVWRAFPLARLNISGVRSKVPQYSWEASHQTGLANLGMQMFSSRQLYEIVVDVFANILHVTTPSEKPWDSAPDYNYRVIRAHAFGSFSDMLSAAMKHPAMLAYLDNIYSQKSSVNENLGRELLELHTVGVGSGYTESDVRNSAYLLSGRSRDDDTGAFVYRPEWHRTGPVRVLGFRHTNADGHGKGAGDLYLRYLARHPATARNVARRLAVRFVSDDPPQSLVDRLAEAYLANDTAIVPVLRVLFASTEFWSSARAKTRRPLEDLVGAVRALNIPAPETPQRMYHNVQGLYWTLDGLSHAPLAWQPPDGYPDVAGAWLSASGMIGRWTAHRALAGGWWGGVQDKGVQVVPSLGPSRPLSEAWKPTPGQTYHQWIDAIAHRVLGRTLGTAKRAAMLAYLQNGIDFTTIKGTDIPQEWESWQAPHLAAFVLDAPEWEIR